AIVSHQRDLFARPNAQVDAAQRPFFGFRIAKTDVLKFDPAPQYRREPLSVAVKLHLRLQTEEIEIIDHEQIILVDVAHRRENRLKGRLSLAEYGQIQGHVTERDFTLDGVPNDPGIGAVESRRGDQA